MRLASSAVYPHCRNSARAVISRLTLIFQTELHHLQFRSQLPAGMRPEFHAGCIVGEDEDVAFLNAGLAEFRQTGMDQLPTNALLTVPPGHRQMMQITAPAIVTAEHGANEATVLFSNKTETRIASQIRRDGRTRVGFVQPHTLSPPPQCEDGIVVFDMERTDGDSIVAMAIGYFLFHSVIPLLAGFHGLG